MARLAFLAAAIAVAVDGFIARRYNLQSELGSYLDPIADKALLVSIYVSLAILQVLPNWLAIIVVTRDVLIVGAGISGVGAAYHLQTQRPGTSFVVLECKDTFGGTWVTHKYPGIRSDSDL